MHELLAVCLMTVDRDSLAAEPGRSRPSPLLTTPAAVRDEAMVATLDRAYAEHDAFQLFTQIMKPAKAFYEWRSEEGKVRHCGVMALTLATRGSGCGTRCSHYHAMRPHTTAVETC